MVRDVMAGEIELIRFLRWLVRRQLIWGVFSDGITEIGNA